MLSDHEPFGFRSLADTIEHTVREGDNWHRIAHRYYSGVYENAERLWWIVADFQPKRVFDPTVVPEVGSTVFVPSTRVVTTQVFSSTRSAAVVRSPSLVPA